jgi:hypothetical protein
MNNIYQISENDLTELAARIIKAVRGEQRTIEPMFTLEEVAAIVRRDKTTLTRWHNSGILKHNSIGLYKKSDIENFLSK